MGNVVLRYGDVGDGTFEERFADWSELRRRLETIRRKYRLSLGIPYSVDLVREGVGRLSAGLGDGEWILFYYSADGNTVLNSVGDERAEGDVLFYFGDHTLLSRKYLVPRKKALQAVRDWFDRGIVSAAIDWTDKMY